MSNLIRWEPVREMMTLREAMDHLFDDAFTRPLTLRDGWSAPAIDMYQTDDEIVVKASLPGVKADEVQINITGEILTLKGETKQVEEKKEKACFGHGFCVFCLRESGERPNARKPYRHKVTARTIPAKSR